MKRLALALLLVLGCGSTRGYHVLLGSVAPTYRGAVRVTREAHIPGRRMTEVALVQAYGTGNQNDLNHVLERLQAEAAVLGCDAIIRLRYDQGVSQGSAIGIAVRTAPGEGGTSFETFQRSESYGAPPNGLVGGESTGVPPHPQGPAPGELRAPWQR